MPEQPNNTNAIAPTGPRVIERPSPEPPRPSAALQAIRELCIPLAKLARAEAHLNPTAPTAQLKLDVAEAAEMIVAVLTGGEVPVLGAEQPPPRYVGGEAPRSSGEWVGHEPAPDPRGRGAR